MTRRRRLVRSVIRDGFVAVAIALALIAGLELIVMAPRVVAVP